MKQVLVFLVFVIHSVVCLGENWIELSIGHYGRLAVPSHVQAGTSIEWAILLSNPSSVPVELEIVVHADLMAPYSGRKISAKLYHTTVTNNLAAGKNKTLPFVLEKEWFSAEMKRGTVRFSAFVKYLTTDEISFNWYFSGFQSVTNNPSCHRIRSAHWPE